MTDPAQLEPGDPCAKCGEQITAPKIVVKIKWPGIPRKVYRVCSFLCGVAMFGAAPVKPVGSAADIHIREDPQ